MYLLPGFGPLPSMTDCDLREFSAAELVHPDMDLELTNCPECGAPAEIVDRFVLPSTEGPVEHVKTRCVTGPWFVVPTRRRRSR
jgi:hypothetical protein